MGSKIQRWGPGFLGKPRVLSGFLFGGGAITITFQQMKENPFLSGGQAFFGEPCFPNTLETKKASLKEDLGHWDPNGGHRFEST